MKKVLALVVIVIAIVVTAVLSRDTRPEGSIRIVALYPLTGGVASWGESAQKSTQMAVDEINAAGGIEDHNLEVVYQDHKCDPKVALSIFEQSLSTSKIFTSSSCSGTVLSIAPSLMKNDAMLLATVVASVKISSSSPHVLRNWAVETRQADLVGQQIKNSGLKKIAILNEQTDFGKGLAVGLQTYLKDTGIEVVTESFVAGATDVRTQLSKFKAEKVEGIFFAPQTETSSEVVLTQMEQLGLKSKIFVNDIVLGAPNLLEKHKILLEGALGGSFVVTSPKLQAFLDAYKARYGTACSHTAACAIAYDSLYMLANTLKSEDTTAGVVKRLKTMNYSGISGETSFDASNDRSGVGYVLTSVRGGKAEVMK